MKQQRIDRQLERFISEFCLSILRARTVEAVHGYALTAKAFYAHAGALFGPKSKKAYVELLKILAWKYENL